MKRGIHLGSGRRGSFLHWALPVACLLPLSAPAHVSISSEGRREFESGDPLDSNDYGSGGGQGQLHQTDSECSGIKRTPTPGPVIGGRQVLLIPINQGGLLTFRLVFIDEPSTRPEAADAR